MDYSVQAYYSAPTGIVCAICLGLCIWNCHVVGRSEYVAARMTAYIVPVWLVVPLALCVCCWKFQTDFTASLRALLRTIQWLLCTICWCVYTLIKISSGYLFLKYLMWCFTVAPAEKVETRIKRGTMKEEVMRIRSLSPYCVWGMCAWMLWSDGYGNMLVAIVLVALLHSIGVSNLDRAVGSIACISMAYSRYKPDGYSFMYHLCFMVVCYRSVTRKVMTLMGHFVDLCNFM